ncbi:MAG: mannose-1-phosphate guanylyltransferase/mannose-6-phosphate isomerase [Hyphomonadaceae bacterium]|nr:mannose-1-phosphate guanylyltransferase/mannose-6-phosphate isomerase [Hyphomonadaceae bacterium]
MSVRIIPAIMSGGAGTRLWPASTETLPKQFHALIGAETLFVQTLRRVSGGGDGLTFMAPIILSGDRYAGAVAAQLAAARAEAQAIVLEPAARNTAAPAAIAALLAQAGGDEHALVLLLPADHIITDRDAFLAALRAAARHAQTHVVTFGVTPDRPDTGFGYIKSGAALGAGVYEIEAFKEKPDAATAAHYLAQGGYSWNAGMFLFKPAVLLGELAAHAPEILAAAETALARGRREGAEVRLEADAFMAAPALPLDIAVMERTARGAVAPCAIGWADVGSWSEIWRLSERDEAGNAAYGSVTALDAQNNLLRGDGVKVCVAGVSDLIVVATPEAVIIVPRERAQDVKTLAERARKLP